MSRGACAERSACATLGPFKAMSHALANRLRLLGAALLFSTGGAAIKAASLSGWQVASFRSGVAALALLALAPATRRGWSLRVLPVGLAYSTTLALFVLANKLTTAANAIFLQDTAPLYLLILGPILLHEPVRRQDLVLIAVMLAGMSLFFAGQETATRTAPDPLQGNLLAAASGISWALTIAGLRWLSAKQGAAAAAPAVVVGNLVAFFGCLPMALPLTVLRLQDAAVVMYLGVVQIALAYVLLTRALAHVPALEASLLLLSEPALNPVWAWLVHGERPGRWALIGGAMILGACAANTWRRREAARG